VLLPSNLNVRETALNGVDLPERTRRDADERTKNESQ
jgi:hypothetical protein